MAGGGALYFPIRLRCADVSDLLGSAGLEDAIARALGRGFARARSALAASVAVGGGVVLQPPCLTGGGLADSDAASLLARVRRAIDAATRRQALPITATNQVAGSAGAMAPSEISEPFDPARFDASSRTYLVPSYKKGKARVGVGPGRGPSPTALTAGGSAQPDWSSVAVRLRDPDEFTATSAFYEIRSLALAWNSYAIAMMMLGVRPNGASPTELVMRVLRRLARQNSHRFRALLRDLRAGYEGIHAAWLERGEDDVRIQPSAGVTVASVLQLHDILGGLLYVAREIDEAHPLAAEWEASARGLGRIASLLSALAEVRAALSRYLAVPLGSPVGRPVSEVPTGAATPRFERTDAAVMARLRAVTANLLRYQAVTMIQARVPEQQDFAYLFQLDLIENVRWIAATLDLVQRIDYMIQELTKLYGAAVDRLEETKILREIRTGVLRDAAEKAMPTAARAGALRMAGEVRLGDWVGIAAERRLENLRRQYAVTIAEIDKQSVDKSGALREIASGDTFTPTDDEFNNAIRDFKAGARKLGQEIAAKWGGARDASYLVAVNALEQRALVTAVRISILSVWRETIRIMSGPDWHHLGGEDDRRRWHTETAAIRKDAQAQYATPNFDLFVSSHVGYCPPKLSEWSSRLNAVCDDLNEVARRERNRTVLLTIGIVIVTAVVSGGLSALEFSTLTITLGEAATFSLLSAAGQHFVLGKSVDPGEVITGFAGNVLMFGGFRLLNVALAAGARRLFPGRELSQLATVFAGNFAVTTLAPALISYIDQGKWSDELSSFLLASLLIQTVGTAIAVPAALKQSRGLNPFQQFRDLMAAQRWLTGVPDFRSELLALGDEWRTAVATGTLDREKFSSLQTRTVQVAERTEAGLRRLTGTAVTDAQLEALRIIPGLNATQTRAVLNAAANLVSEYRAAVSAAPNAGQVGRQALPAPAAVISEELVAVSGNTIQYDPNTKTETLVRRFGTVGYTVKQDGKVLRLLPPGEDVPRYLLLPAAPDVPAPSLTRLVSAPQSLAARGLRVLQLQSAVPPLEYMLTLIAKSRPPLATDLMTGIGRHVPATETLAIQGFAHVLEIGGAEMLKIVLGLGTRLRAGSTSATSRYGTNEVRVALGRFTTLSASDLGGIEAIIRLRGDGRSAFDGIVGIAVHFDPPGPVYSALGTLESRTESGLNQLVGQLASPNAALRQEAHDAMLEGIDIVGRSPTRRLRFERRTIGGQQALRARDAGVTSTRTLTTYTPAQLDDIVARTPDIKVIRQLAQSMVQGSSGSLFERWARQRVFEAPKGVSAVRLRVRQVDNVHIRMTKTVRSSDSYLSANGEWWDAKAYQSGAEIDVDQMDDNRKFVRAGYVYTEDGVRHPVTSHNYLFIDWDSAQANLSLVKVQGNGRVWYIDDNSQIRPL
jgi:hypothetical protein